MTAVCGLAVRIGRKAYPMTSFEQVSRAYRDTIAQSGVAPAQAPRCEILNLLGEVIAHVAPNGRIWRGSTYQPGERPLYEPQ
jgi:hypothetical protein